QSKVISTVPIEQVKIALRNSGRPDTMSVPADIARELAYRSAIPVVVDGKVTRLGSSTTVTLKATSSADGRVLVSTTGTAAGDPELVPVRTRRARELRRGLGETKGVFVAASWTDAATPSFEAFKLFLRGRELINRNDSWSAVPILRRAVALDSSFATAWTGLAIALGNTGQRDSARVCLRQGLGFSERPTPA